MEEISVKSSKRNEMIDITAEVEEIVRKSKVNDGICIVYVPHTTAAVTVNENADPSVKSDIIEMLNKLIPANAGYSHTEGNADSHIKSSLVGCSEIIPIKNNLLVLGTWQGVCFCEFDGPRNRKALVQIISNDRKRI